MKTHHVSCTGCTGCVIYEMSHTYHTNTFVHLVITCHEKAVFLLKFAGLSRVAQEEGEEGLDEVDGNPTLSPSWPRRSSQHWQKVSNAISTVGRLKQQVLRAQPMYKALFNCFFIVAEPWRTSKAS